MRAADWYFDFVSPFSYLQLERLRDWPASVTLRPRPVLFAGLLDHWGTKGPAEVDAKRTFIYRQVQWIADREGIALRFPPSHPFNPLRALRLAVALESDLAAIRAIYRFIWGEGREVGTDEGWHDLARRLGIADADRLVSDPEVKAGLRRNGEQAIAAGVFGVPTLAIDGMLFWGADATPMALDYLEHPDRFQTPEMRRIATLAVGASRPAGAGT
jgi:2-hydroxychromene-2-carboxylate isomerase